MSFLNRERVLVKSKLQPKNATKNVETELTANNRVAAADMLGVSRQSLYVKLRKYDLMSKGINNN